MHCNFLRRGSASLIPISTWERYTIKTSYNVSDTSCAETCTFGQAESGGSITFRYFTNMNNYTVSLWKSTTHVDNGKDIYYYFNHGIKSSTWANSTNLGYVWVSGEGSRPTTVYYGYVHKGEVSGSELYRFEYSFIYTRIMKINTVVSPDTFVDRVYSINDSAYPDGSHQYDSTTGEYYYYVKR